MQSRLVSELEEDKAVTGPDSSQVEVNLFGPGYGESVLVHLCANRWLIVDSCVRATSAGPAALEYLDRIGVDIGSSVLYLVATHWHDDHVSGFATQVKRCARARVHFTAALTCESLLKFIESDFPQPVSKLSEMTKSLEELRGSGSKRYPERPYHFVGEHFPVHLESLHPGGPPVAIWALSPSSADRTETAKQLRRILNQDSNYSPTGLPKPKDNHTSVVLHVTVGNQHILLGADREKLSGAMRGWNSVKLCYSARNLDPASLYKVAHHGSPNADDDLIWEDLLMPQPVALLAPFRKGLEGGRPRPMDIARLCGRTRRAYSTSVADTANGESDPVYEPVMDAGWEFHRALDYEVEDAQVPMGHLRARAAAEGGPWHVDPFPPAGQLCRS